VQRLYYLICPVRQWWERAQGSTREGRAKLRLELITASWLQRPARRQLPSLLEWMGILRHVPQRDWSDDERRLMRATARLHLARAVTVLGLLVALGVGGKLVGDRLRAAEKLRHAFTAQDRELPAIIAELERYRNLVAGDLEAKDRAGRPHEREVAGLLLYRFAPTRERGQYLHQRLLAATTPDQVEPISDALAAHPEHADVATLRANLDDVSTKPTARLSLAAALVGLEPIPKEQGGAMAAALTEALLEADRLTVPRWLELLHPAVRGDHLVERLRQICCDRDRDPTRRSTAAEVLVQALRLRGDDTFLARAMTEAEPEASRILQHELERLGRREPVLAYLRRVLAEPLDQARGELGKDRTARRQAGAAIALAALGSSEKLWPCLRHRKDPRLRTLLILSLAEGRLPPRVLLERLNRPEVDPVERQALLLAWAEMAETARKTAAVPVEADTIDAARLARSLYLDDPHPGVHSAAELVLRRWRKGLLDQCDAQLRADPPRHRGWMLGPKGHTLAVLHGPLGFLMGSPEHEERRFDYENLHYRRIDRSIAVATKEDTFEQIRAFDPDHPQNSRHCGTDPDSVAGGVSWFKAARYCNWLSELEGLPPYYRISAEGVTVSGGCGYRLPTEAEWEYFCRAGTETARPFGESQDHLSRFAWTWLNSDDRAHRVGLLLPNELGLFDTLGNVWEWCDDGKDRATTSDFYQPYPTGTRDDPAPDPVRKKAVQEPGTWRIVRGGSYEAPPFYGAIGPPGHDHGGPISRVLRPPCRQDTAAGPGLTGPACDYRVRTRRISFDRHSWLQYKC
jgi:formylglycine-generating enzyme required for sulfatase activity